LFANVVDADRRGQDRAVGLPTQPNAVVVDGDDLESSCPTVQVARPDLDLGAGDEALRAWSRLRAKYESREQHERFPRHDLSFGWWEARVNLHGELRGGLRALTAATSARNCPGGVAGGSAEFVLDQNHMG
jgi:hypothetical protein